MSAPKEASVYTLPSHRSTPIFLAVTSARKISPDRAIPAISPSDPQINFFVFSFPWRVDESIRGSP
jgi:hypothetical protein